MLVRKSARRVLFILMTVALTLTACNMGATPAPTVDINTINTAAYNTAMAQISVQNTQTALAAPSATSSPTVTSAVPQATIVLPGNGTVAPTVGIGTPFSLNPASTTTTNTTPLAGFTPLGSPAVPIAAATTASLGDACSNSAFEGDITIPDGSVMKPGENFTKVWKLRNTGSCTWDEGFTLVYIGGTGKALDPYNYKFGKGNGGDLIASGEAIDIAINLSAPCAIGEYEGHWRMQNDKGYYFGTILSVYIKVTEKDKKCGNF